MYYLYEPMSGLTGIVISIAVFYFCIRMLKDRKNNKKIKQMNNVKTKLEKGEAVYPYDLDALSDKEYHELTGVKRDKTRHYVLLGLSFIVLIIFRYYYP